ncbi:MAG: hypothetical protein ABGZ17_32160, partial [Planctomycetaceae bacterium]
MSDPVPEFRFTRTRLVASQSDRQTSGVARPAAWFGSTCLLFSVVVLVLAFISGQGAPAGMPYLWTAHRPLWYLMGSVAFVCGWNLLREPRPGREQWSPEVAGVRFRRLVLYTRGACHLCDQAKDTLLKYS